jgi:hypothetical protein
MSCLLWVRGDITPEALYANHLRKVERPVDAKLQAQAPKLAALIAQCMRVDPKARPTALQVSSRLKAVFNTTLT